MMSANQNNVGNIQVEFEIVKQEPHHSEELPIITGVYSQSSFKEEHEFSNDREAVNAEQSRSRNKTPEGNESYVCDVCSAKFRSRFRLQTHVMKEHHPNPYKCTTCDEAFQNSLSLKEHMKQHYGQPSHQCPICGMCFVRVLTLRHHMLLHSPPPTKPPEQLTSVEVIPATNLIEQFHRCHICNTHFRMKFDLAAHLDKMHAKSKQQCGVCGKTLPTPARLVKHMRIMHADFRPYACRKCGAKFSHKETWRRHEMKRCERAPRDATELTCGSSHLVAVCKVCCDEFTSMTDLDSHMIATHPGKHSFDCKLIDGRLVLEGSMEMQPGADPGLEENQLHLKKCVQCDSVMEVDGMSCSKCHGSGKKTVDPRDFDPDPDTNIDPDSDPRPVPMFIYRNQGADMAPTPVMMWSSASCVEGDNEILSDDGDLILP